MLKNAKDIQSQDFSGGLNTINDIFKIERNQSTNLMDVKVNFDGSAEKRLGSNTMNSVVLAESGLAGWKVDVGNSLTSNLVAYWRLDEKKGMREDLFKTHVLEDVNTVGVDDGIQGASAKFTSALTNYLLHDNTSSLSSDDEDFSLSGWFSLSDTGNQTFISKRDYDKAVLLLHMSGADTATTIIDSSSDGNTMTSNSGAIIDVSQFQFGSSSSALFNGSASWISTPDSASWDFSNNFDYEIQMQIRFASKESNMGIISQTVDSSNCWLLTWDQSAGQLFYIVNSENTSILDYRPVWDINTAQWYDLKVLRKGTSVGIFVDGTTLATTTSSEVSFPDLAATLDIGRSTSATSGNITDYMDGWIDELRINKGYARSLSNHSGPTADFGTQTDFEYWLGVGTDSVVSWKVSSSGLAEDGAVSGTSFGALDTGKLYNITAWHDAGSNEIGLEINLSQNTASYASGMRLGSAPFVVGAISNGEAEFLSGRADELGVWKKVLSAQEKTDIYRTGTGNTYEFGFDGDPLGSFDFGASNIRWLTVAAGTGIYASSNLGVEFVTIATDRTAGYQNFERSKNVLVCGSDYYDPPLYWNGSAGTFAALLNVSAPNVRFLANFQGFLIGLNSDERKRGFYYEDQNTQLTGDWEDNFDFPSSQDDEITGWFVLRKKFYVSTRYKMFRVTFVGGNPDWSYLEIKDWGFVPRTIEKVTIADIGEVVVGMSWDRRFRLFDGADDRIISDNVENDNKMCDFALDKISYAGSGLAVAHAELDANQQVYKCNVAIGSESTHTTHFINFDPRTLAMYPYQNQRFQTMTMAESNNQRFLMAVDRSGRIHMMNTGNLDGDTTPIDDVFDSSFIFDVSPSMLHKGYKLDMFFSPTSSNNVYFSDRVDFSQVFKQKEVFKIVDTNSVNQIMKEIDTPTSFNVYQFRISSSSGTSEPWRINRSDYHVIGFGVGKGE